jgi:hypothetical protein
MTDNQEQTNHPDAADKTDAQSSNPQIIVVFKLDILSEAAQKRIEQLLQKTIEEELASQPQIEAVGGPQMITLGYIPEENSPGSTS